MAGHGRLPGARGMMDETGFHELVMHEHGTWEWQPEKTGQQVKPDPWMNINGIKPSLR